MINKKEYNVPYSDYENNRGLHGVGFIIISRIMKAVSEFEPVNARLTRLRIRGRLTRFQPTHRPRIAWRKIKMNFTLSWRSYVRRLASTIRLS